jgi:3-phenylpropionate/trans-cinnamate dioxygenase ferredoxin reductase component
MNGAGVLVAGGGVAGLRVAETLRARGYDRPVTVVGAEPVPPYERPALSKDLLAGTRSAEDLQLRSAEWLADRDIGLVVGSRVDRLDPARRTVRVAGREMAWEHLVLATGARPRRLPGLTEAHVLRTLGDAAILQERLGPGVRLVVLGAGLVGAEVASTAVSLGCDVTIVDPAAGPMHHIVRDRVAGLLADRWRRAGVETRFEARVAKTTSGELHLTDGKRVGFDVLLVAVGTEPAVELVRPGPGLATDACGRTCFSRVYACGDVARFAGQASTHWTAAAGQARAVASAIVGEPEPYRDQGYFWSDQFGLRLQMAGESAHAVGVEIDGDEDSFAARYRDAAGRTVAVLLANKPAEVGAARRELAAAA